MKRRERKTTTTKKSRATRSGKCTSASEKHVPRYKRHKRWKSCPIAVTAGLSEQRNDECNGTQFQAGNGEDDVAEKEILFGQQNEEDDTVYRDFPEFVAEHGFNEGVDASGNINKI